jgi:hypothetical protein
MLPSTTISSALPPLSAIDLLRFVEDCRSGRIIVWSDGSGADVKRCGSEAEPCKRVEYGRTHMEEATLNNGGDGLGKEGNVRAFEKEESECW